MRIIQIIVAVSLATVGIAAPADNVEARQISCSVVTPCPPGYYCNFGGPSVIGYCWPLGGGVTADDA
jgi:hypothetical protein